MTHLARLILIVALGLSPSLPAAARDLNAADKAELQTRIDTFGESFRTGDLAAVMDVMPPHMLKTLAEQNGMQPAQLKSAMIEATRQAMSQLTVVSYNMDLDSARFGQSSAARGYALVPTVTVMKVDGQTIKGTTHTLAFEEDDTWYLVRIDNAQQIGMLTSAYPEFKGVDFPTGSMKVVE